MAVLAGGLAVVALGLGYFAWKENEELIGLRAAALGGDERAELRKRAWDAESRAKQLDAQLAAERASNGAKAAVKEGEAPAKAPAPKQNPSVAERIAMLSNPEIQQAMTVKFREQVDTRYGALFKTMNLAGPARAQLKELLVERQAVIIDVAAAAAQQSMQDGKKFDQAQMSELIATAQGDIDQKLQASMGAEAFAQFQNYENAQLFRGATANLQSGLAMVKTPMTDEQAEQFTVNIAGLAQSSFSAEQKKSIGELTRLQQTAQTMRQLEQIMREQNAPKNAKGTKTGK